jgi:KTSC domain
MTSASVSSVGVNSSLLSGVGYEAHSTLLHLEFRDGSVHDYFGVPVDVYQGLLAAESKGAYFNRRIRDAFQHARLRPSD